MPVLGMNQDTGKLIHWLVEEGQPVEKGQPLFEVETDKTVAEIEAPASGVLGNLKAQPGEEVPVGQVIAIILPAGEKTSPGESAQEPIAASPLARRMAAEQGVDLPQIKPQGGKVEKADVLAYLQTRGKAGEAAHIPTQLETDTKPRRPLASPKARRLAAEKGLDLAALKGSGPQGAVLAADVLAPRIVSSAAAPVEAPSAPQAPPPVPQEAQGAEITPGSIWRIMAERTTASWTQAPHFYLLREVDATRLVAWRAAVNKDGASKVTYTDLLVKLVAAALRRHPRLNAVYQDGKIRLLPEVNVGLAVAVEEGLVVPVIHQADTLGVSQIAEARSELVEKALAGRLRPADVAGGSFTISNLGMYGVDAFLAVVNAPQAAILAVGRIAERVVPLNGQAVIRPMIALSLSFDHRAIDGARGAQFLDTLAGLIEEPLGLVS